MISPEVIPRPVSPDYSSHGGPLRRLPSGLTSDLSAPSVVSAFAGPENFPAFPEMCHGNHDNVRNRITYRDRGLESCQMHIELKDGISHARSQTARPLPIFVHGAWVAKCVLFVLVFFTQLVPDLSAQVYLQVDSLTVDQGQTFSLEVTADSFEDIVSLQMSMRWDSSVIRLDSVRSFGLPLLDPSDFNILNPGLLTMVWFDFSLQGVNAPESGLLFTLHFTAVGPPGSKSAVSFDQSPTTIEIGRLEGAITVAVDYEVNSGEVCIDLGTSSVEPPKSDFELRAPFPNPFHENIFVPCALPQSAIVTYMLVDMGGEIWGSGTHELPAGDHQFIIPSSAALRAGLYTLLIHVNGMQYARKIIFVPKSL